MGQGGSLTEATTTTQIIWGLLNTPEDIKGNVRKDETRIEGEKVQMKREASKALKEKKKLGLLPLSLVRSADINSKINERNKTRSARKRFLKRGRKRFLTV